MSDTYYASVGIDTEELFEQACGAAQRVIIDAMMPDKEILIDGLGARFVIHQFAAAFGLSDGLNASLAEDLNETLQARGVPYRLVREPAA